jgi:hypothetical protein
MYYLYSGLAIDSRGRIDGWCDDVITLSSLEARVRLRIGLIYLSFVHIQPLMCLGPATHRSSIPALKRILTHLAWRDKVEQT